MLDTIITILMFCFLLTFPMFTMQHPQKNKHRLENPEFKAKWGTLYFEIDTRKEEALFWTGCHLYRRFFLAVSIGFMSFNVVFQVFLNVCSSLMITCVAFAVRPFDTGLNNLVNCFNEFVLLCASHYIFTFTAFTHDNEAKYKLGWAYLYCVAVVLVLNLMSPLVKLAKFIKTKCKQKRLKNQARKSKICAETPPNSVNNATPVTKSSRQKIIDAIPD